MLLLVCPPQLLGFTISKVKLTVTDKSKVTIEVE
jgi:hypothetical protein